MTYEITEPTLKLCWNTYAIRGAIRALRAAHLDLMADDIEAQVKPAITEPELSFSVINARPSYSDTVTTLTKLGDRWVDIDGNDVGPFCSLADVEVLRVGILPESTEDYAAGVKDTIDKIHQRLQYMLDAAISSERKNALEKAIQAVEELTP